MIRRALFILFISVLCVETASSQDLKSPSSYLGYELGERFSFHYQVVDYFEYVADQSSSVQLEPYGYTNERRPLITAIISSEENLANWEKIKAANLGRVGKSDASGADQKVAIVWLSYNIHGNESSSMEAAMKTIFHLVTDEDKKEWLKNTVIVMDPAVNPDGRDRYAHYFNMTANQPYNPKPEAREHNEPWPGGRPNHYLFDLNRDWLWQTQVESAARITKYRTVYPHIHVDFHEQGYNSPYYFAPAAEPYHKIITDWQRQFQVDIGKNHAKYFDKEGWLYFTKERFDLLYPSYGDTYPTYNGAIGMTYEQGGHGRGGLGVITEYGDTLTLKDRIEHHYTTGISTVEMASKNADRLIEEFEKYFTNRVSSTYKTFVIKNTTATKDRVNKLAAFLDQNDIDYGSASTSRSVRAFDYKTGRERSVSVAGSDLVVSVNQPKSRLVKALFEPEAVLSDSMTYDITAWSLPYAYGLEAYALEDNLSTGAATADNAYQIDESIFNANVYAYALPYYSLEDVKWMGELMQQDVNIRVLMKPITIEGKALPRGTLIVTRRTNEKHGKQFDAMILEATKKFHRNVIALNTGFSDAGVDLGSGYVSRLETPKIAVISGEGTRSTNFGEIWHFFEQQINYPFTAIHMEDFNRVDWNEYNVLVLPEGRYEIFNESGLKKLTEWVQGGGKVVALGSAVNSFKDKDGFAVKTYRNDEQKKSLKDDDDDALKTYASTEREALNAGIFGSIFKSTLDNTHPLAYGMPTTYFTLKTSNRRVAYLPDGFNVGTLRGEAIPVSGFAGYKSKKGLKDSLVFGVENKGSGQLIYLVDNPLFRAFWEGGKLVFANAVFMVD